MSQQKKSLFLKLISVVLFTSFSSVFLLLLYSSKLILTTPFEKIRNSSDSLENKSELVSQKISFEQDSRVLKQELKDFFLFSKENSKWSTWYGKNQRRGLLAEERGKGVVFIQEDIDLAALHSNECEDYNCYQVKIAFQNLPSSFWKALIGIEDNRFLSHKGFDLKSILRALWIDFKKWKLVQGGSTITQQLVKNLFLSNEKTLIRKFKELILAVYVEYKFEKKEIVESYLNEFTWGTLQGVRIRGVFAASTFFFGKRPNQLSSFEVSILISLLKGPYFYSPTRHPQRLKKRASVVYNRLAELNLFPSGSSLEWGEKKWKKWLERLKKNEKERPYIGTIVALNQKSSLLNQYEVFTFHRKVQYKLNRIQNKTGKNKYLAVKAIFNKVGAPLQNGFQYYSKVGRNINKSLTMSKHQVGSTLKPLIYKIFLNHGKYLEDEVSTGRISLNLKSGTWTPRESIKSLPPVVTLETALLKSLNGPLIRTAEEIGFDLIEKDLLEYFPGLARPLREYPSQLLGAQGMSLARLHKVYESFISKECLGGDLEGRNPSVIELLSDPAKTTVSKMAKGEIRKLSFFGKTGTSNGGKDNWYVFYDGMVLGVIWLGDEGPRTNEVFPLSGSSTAFYIFQGFIQDRGKRFNEFFCKRALKSGKNPIKEEEEINY